jgi:hypothetical protein
MGQRVAMGQQQLALMFDLIITRHSGPRHTLIVEWCESRILYHTATCALIIAFMMMLCGVYGPCPMFQGMGENNGVVSYPEFSVKNIEALT